MALSYIISGKRSTELTKKRYEKFRLDLKKVKKQAYNMVCGMEDAIGVRLGQEKLELFKKGFR